MHSANGHATNGHANGRVNNSAPLFYTSHPVYHDGEPVNRWERLLGATDLTGNATTLTRADLRNRGIDTRRDIDADCGYPSSISPSDYQRMYERDAIASRVVEVMPKESWAVQPTVYETEDPNDVTEFEEAWDALGKDLSATRSFYQDELGSVVWSYLLRADVLAGIGQYGVILLGLDDGLDLSWPVDGFEEWNSQPVDSPEGEGKKIEAYVKELGLTREQAAQKLADLRRVQKESRYASGRTTAWTVGGPMVTVNAGGRRVVKNRATDAFAPEADGLVDESRAYKVTTPKESKKGGKRRLLYMRVFGEASASISQFESNPTSPRYGQPTQYLLTFNSNAGETNGVGLPTQTMTVHWTRVIHVVDYSGSTSESEVFHVPRMRPVFNHLINLQRMYAGSAEGYWQACVGKLFVQTNPQLGGNVNVNETALKNMFENMRHGTSREGVLKGLEPVLIAPSPPDPTPFIANQIEAICVNLACPVPVFKGYEIGEQASTNNSEKWNGVIKHRWLFHNGPGLIVKLVDRLILCQVLPEPKAAIEEPDEPKAMSKDNPSEGVGPPIKGATPPAPPQFGAKKPAPPTGNAVFTKRYFATVMVYNAETGEAEPQTRQVGTATVVKTRSGYSIEWPDLESQDASTKATIIGTLTSALSAYAGPGNAATVMPPMEYFTKVWNLDEEEVAEMMDSAATHVEDQQSAAMEQQQAAIDAGLAPDPTKPPEPPPGTHPDDANPDSNPFRTPTGNADPLANVFCPTGPGGGVKPNCKSRMGRLREHGLSHAEAYHAASIASKTRAADAGNTKTKLQHEKDAAEVVKSMRAKPTEQHEMTRAEYAHHWRKLETGKEPFTGPHADEMNADVVRQFGAGHDVHIKAALAAGKPVPPHVLADYPDLVAKHAAPVSLNDKKVADLRSQSAESKRLADAARQRVAALHAELGDRSWTDAIVSTPYRQNKHSGALEPHTPETMAASEAAQQRMVKLRADLADSRSQEQFHTQQSKRLSGQAAELERDPIHGRRKADHVAEGKDKTKAGKAARAAEHREAVASAIAAGRPVPPEVLADYPDLVKNATLNAFCSTGKGGGVDPTCGDGDGQAKGGGAGGKGADASPAAAHGPAHAKPAASPNVNVSYGGDQTKVTAAIRTTFGKDVHPNTLAGAANALDGADVHISTTPHSGLLQVVVRNKNGSEAKRTFYKDHKGELVCDNGAFNNKVKDGEAKVPGAEMLKNQVQHLREIGVSKIVTQAEGSKSDAKGYVGYTVWPKLGYDGQMTEGQFAKLPKEVQAAMGKKKGFLGLGGNKGSRSVMALHNVPGGEEAWKEHGSTFAAHFDLTDGSANMKTLDAYLAKKGK